MVLPVLFCTIVYCRDLGIFAHKFCLLNHTNYSARLLTGTKLQTNGMIQTSVYWQFTLIYLLLSNLHLAIMFQMLPFAAAELHSSIHLIAYLCPQKVDSLYVHCVSKMHQL